MTLHVKGNILLYFMMWNTQCSCHYLIKYDFINWLFNIYLLNVIFSVIPSYTLMKCSVLVNNIHMEETVSQILILCPSFFLWQKMGNLLTLFSILFTTLHKIKTKQKITNLRQRFLPTGMKKDHKKYQVSNFDSYWDIHFFKMGVKYSIFEFLAHLHRLQFIHNRKKYTIGLVYKMAFMDIQ